jgi:excisionase family DNA binding protein
MAGLDAGELLALPFLTIRSAACALGLSPEGVRRAIQTGRLAAVRLKGGKWRIAADDVRAWIAARKTRAAR